VRIDEVADGVFVAVGSLVNWTIIRDGRELTLVDGGFPGDRRRVLASIESLGHSPQDVRAILGTHAHVDHIGAFEHFVRHFGTPVHMSGIDAFHAEKGDYEQASPGEIARHLGNPRVLPWALRVLSVGGSGRPTVPETHGFDTLRPLDVPGRPVPVSCPGHTYGHVAFHLPERGVLLAGDAIATGHPVSAISGPQLLPDFFAADAERAEKSLGALAKLSADVLVCGHGEPWSGSPAGAVEIALDRHRNR